MPAVRELERQVLGCDYGGTSWTTRAQADHIAQSLELRAGVHLLEIGAGSGWPGLYLGTTSGCDVALLDIPLNALKQIVARAAKDQITRQTLVLAGSGAALPIASASFDRLSHSDVLCCMPEKLAMLRECRRVATAEARMYFSVIQPTPNISPADYQRAIEFGPPFIDIPNGYEPLLQASRWRIRDQIDVTAEFRQSLKILIEGIKSNTHALQEAYGVDELASQQQRRQEQIVLIENGILQREVFVSSAI